MTRNGLWEKEAMQTASRLLAASLPQDQENRNPPNPRDCRSATPARILSRTKGPAMKNQRCGGGDRRKQWASKVSLRIPADLLSGIEARLAGLQQAERPRRPQ